MKNKFLQIFLISSVFWGSYSGCKSAAHSDVPEPHAQQKKQTNEKKPDIKIQKTSFTEIFRENFDDAKNLKSLFPTTKPLRWTSTQQTRKPNTLVVTKEKFHSGNQSLKFFAEGTNGGNLSKTSLVRDIFSFHPGDKVKISAWYYIPSGQKLKHITIMDFECWDCWSSFNIVRNKSPGLRLQISDDQGTLYVDRGKIGYRNKHFKQSPTKRMVLPRDRWFKIDWVLDLGFGDAGLTEVFIDDKKIISGKGTNIPDPDVFIKLLVKLKKPTKYDAITFGVSANEQKTDVSLYVDDIWIGVIKGVS